MMFSIRAVVTSMALLVVLFPSASVGVAQQQDAENATLMTNDDNTTDSSSLLMTNYNALREEGQGFFLQEQEASLLYEKPDSVATSSFGLHWWCDLKFASDDATNYGYVGRAVKYSLGSSLEGMVAQGAQSFPSKLRALSVSAVLVPTHGIFEGPVLG